MNELKKTIALLTREEASLDADLELLDRERSQMACKQGEVIQGKSKYVAELAGRRQELLSHVKSSEQEGLCIQREIDEFSNVQADLGEVEEGLNLLKSKLVKQANQMRRSKSVTPQLQK